MRKIIIAFVVLVLFLLFGCTQTNNSNIDLNQPTDNNLISNQIETIELSLDKAYSIIKTDKDYSDFVKLTVNFSPDEIEYFSLQNYDKNSLGEAIGNERIANAIKEYLTVDFSKKNYYYVKLIDNNNKYDLIAIIDVKNNKSELIIAYINVLAGV
jgi:hypothetical protein